MKEKAYILLPLLLTGALFTTTTAQASAKTVQRVGKAASITLDHETQVGNVVLPAGDYTVRDRVVGTDHFMVFQQTKGTSYTAITFDVGKPQQVECRMESLGAKVSDTTASFHPEGNIDRLTKIVIAGETVEHLF